MVKDDFESDLLDKAMAAKQDQDNQAAMEYLEKILEKNPKNSRALNMAGIIFYEREQLEKARDSFSAAIRNDHTLIDAQHNYGETLIAMEDYENGVKAFARILENHTEYIPAILRLAHLSAEAGRLDNAEAYCKQVFKLDPDNEQAQKLMDLLPKLRARQQYNTRQPGHQDELFEKALSAHQKGENDQAFMIINELLASNPNHAKAYNLAGNIFMENDNLENAKKSFIAALNCNSDFTNAHHNLARTYKKLKKFDQSRKIYNQIIDQNPEDIKALINLAEVNLNLGNQKQAHKFAETVLEKEPNNAKARDFLNQ
ncbi:MAG: tetratricopeptide repeat protein [Candidatus Marinimicrobia bacterium]|nr:tetratricopeptide repeat protein [Candidatus Neomarinimicrobiota bacterium]